jgi:hypothetical protein
MQEMQERKNDINNEISNYQAASNGMVECMPSFLRNVAD